MTTIHKSVFGHSNLLFAGNIRKEAVYVGSGANEFQGSLAENIKADLITLYQNSFPSLNTLQTCSERTFLRYCARFMEELLKIHPFLDGNGRLTRLFLYFFAKHSGKYRFRSFNTDPESIREYLNALEYGHRHNIPTVAGESNGNKKDPFALLYKWLAKHIDQKPINEKTEEQKPDWIP